MRYFLASAAIFALIGTPGCKPSDPESLPEIRRIVTSEDGDGRAIVVADGAPTNVVELNGSRIERLWETGGIPTRIPVTVDAGETAGNAYREGFVGSSLYIADIPPGSDLQDIPIHRQDSLDYIALLEGEIDLVLDTGEVLSMRRGDILVQAGNAHSWINRGAGTARLLCVVLTGERSPPGSDNALASDSD